jgi:hypothetical protein
MPIQTISPIAVHLEQFNNAWILSKEGATNQLDRRNAITQARENVSNMPDNNYTWLIDHLTKTIAVDLQNSQPYEIGLRLRLTAYAIIKHLRTQQGNAGTLSVLALRVKEFTRICNGGTIE